MPTYTYRCECGHTFELTRSVAERRDAVCPKCHKTPRIVPAAVTRHWKCSKG